MVHGWQCSRHTKIRYYCSWPWHNFVNLSNFTRRSCNGSVYNKKCWCGHGRILNCQNSVSQMFVSGGGFRNCWSQANHALFIESSWQPLQPNLWYEHHQTFCEDWIAVAPTVKVTLTAPSSSIKWPQSVFIFFKWGVCIPTSSKSLFSGGPWNQWETNDWCQL